MFLENSQVYVSLPNIHFSNDDQTVVDISIGNETRRLQQIMSLHFLILVILRINKL